MMESSSNLNLDLHHQEDQYFHGSSTSITSPLPLPFHFVGRNHDSWINNQDLPLNSADHNFMRLSHDTIPTVQGLGFQYGTDQEGSGYMIKEELGFDPSVIGGFGRGSFGMVPPTPNISGLNPLTTTSYPSSLGMGVQALDLLASGRFGRMLCQPTAMDTMANYGIGQLQEPAAPQQATQTKISHTISTGVSNRQPNGDSLEYKASQSVAKKPRFESRASFTPFKVRKEKLGDRIAALQQLVAPFGKTDTASVLMEAIGYIKFLQDQVETLSVPYMRSSNTKKTRTSGEASSDEREEAKVDLRSRGLCLVPLACTSYVTNENGGVWSPPNYRGGGGT